MTDQDLEPKPLAQITIGPTAFEEFLDRNQGRLIVAAIVLILVAAGIVIAHHVKSDYEAAAAAAVTVCYDETTGKYDPVALQKVCTDYKNTPAAETAEYLYAMSLWDDGKTDESVKEMEDFIVNNPDSPLKNQAALILAGRGLQTGKAEVAVKYFQLVADSNDEVYAPVALMSLCDIARTAGDKEKAKGYYEDVRAKYPDSSFAYDQKVQNPAQSNDPSMKSPVGNRLDILNLDAPKAVAPPIKLPSLKPDAGKGPLAPTLLQGK